MLLFRGVAAGETGARPPAAPSPGDPFRTLVEAFLWALGTTKPSPHTVAAYRRDLLGIGTRIAAGAARTSPGCASGT
jgi:hypothetical protein